MHLCKEHFEGEKIRIKVENSLLHQWIPLDAMSMHLSDCAQLCTTHWNRVANGYSTAFCSFQSFRNRYKMHNYIFCHFTNETSESQ